MDPHAGRERLVRSGKPPRQPREEGGDAYGASQGAVRTDPGKFRSLRVVGDRTQGSSGSREPEPEPEAQHGSQRSGWNQEVVSRDRNSRKHSAAPEDRCHIEPFGTIKVLQYLSDK